MLFELGERQLVTVFMSTVVWTILLNRVICQVDKVIVQVAHIHIIRLA